MLHHILVLDNDDSWLRLATDAWYKYGGCLKAVSSPQQATDRLRKSGCDLVVITADSVKEQLLSTIGQIRNISSVPIMVLTSRYTGIEKIASIHAGADDYLPFPQTVEEGVISGVSLIRRSAPSGYWPDRKKLLTCGDLKLDTEKRKLYVAGKPLVLTKGEFYCLELLMNEPGKVFDLDTIYHCAFRDAPIADDIVNSVRALAKRIRNKIHPDQTKYIKTSRGMGYYITSGEDFEYTLII